MAINLYINLYCTFLHEYLCLSSLCLFVPAGRAGSGKQPGDSRPCYLSVCVPAVIAEL